MLSLFYSIPLYLRMLHNTYVGTSKHEPMRKTPWHAFSIPLKRILGGPAITDTLRTCGKIFVKGRTDNITVKDT